MSFSEIRNPYTEFKIPNNTSFLNIKYPDTPFAEFQSQTQNNSRSRDHELLTISQVLPHLFISGIYPLEKRPQELKNLNIDCIVSCVGKPYVGEVHDNIMFNIPELEVLYVPYNDDTRENLFRENNNNVSLTKFVRDLSEMSQVDEFNKSTTGRPLIDITYSYIDNCLKNNKNVLVHCMAGVSRSASVVIYYLMRRYNMSFQDARDYLTSRRGIVQPNAAFEVQLTTINRNTYSA